MNKNSLKKLKSFITKETTMTYPKQIIPGNIRLSFGMFRTLEEQEEYMKQQEKNLKRYSKKELKQYQKYLKKQEKK